MAAATDKESLDALKLILKRIADNANHFELLGLEAGAEVNEAKDAFLRLARLLHPDLPVFKPTALRADATRAFGAVSGANKTLTDPVLRAQYLSDTGYEPEQSQEEEANPDLARIHVHRARGLLARKDWQNAEDGLSLAARLFGDEEHDECKTLLGWAILNNPMRSETERASKSHALWTAVLESKRQGPAEAQANYYMALWCKLHGEVPKVKTYLDRCLKVDPKHIEAQRELRLFERRRASSTMPAANKVRSGRERRKSRSDIPAAAAATGERARPHKIGLDQKKKKTWLDKLLGR